MFQLSGGKQVRLSLAQIAASTPKLLILDEIANNPDLETRRHVIEALIIPVLWICIMPHNTDFLERIGVDNYYQITHGILLR